MPLGARSIERAPTLSGYGKLGRPPTQIRLVSTPRSDGLPTLPSAWTLRAAHERLGVKPSF